MSALRTRLQYLLSVLSVLLVIVLAAVGWGWWQMRGSLAQLDGERAVAGLAAPVKIERDALGVPTITGATRPDVARALGFLHAQDRFFQMDLLRRSGAGELAEVFGAMAVPLDRSHRLHGFRRTAGQVVAALDPAERAVLDAYTAGVNAGLAALPKPPWEYLVLRTAPQPWRAEDSLLCFYAMWFDLQDFRGAYELNRAALREALGQSALDFLAPQGNSWDAALDGSTFDPAPLPSFRFKPAEQTVGVVAPKRPWTVAGNGAEPEPERVVGSNAFALAGAHTATGAALLANDMHLDLNVPHVWYRAVLQWTGDAGPRRLAGVTLPGTPLLTVGSNGRVAWGFTNAYIDTTDIIMAETDAIAQSHYRTPDGWKEIEERPEEIRVKGQPSVPFTARWTRWGPIIGGPQEGRYLVLRWTAHDPAATNMRFMAMETAHTTAEAVAIAHRTGIPNENILIADADGDVAWTIIGLVPRRVGYDGRLPVSWGYGDRRWDGWLPTEEIPVVTSRPGARPAEIPAPDGALWSGNNRAVGGPALASLGDSGHDDGPRARQIRDNLRALVAAGKKAAPADLLAVQLDDRAVFLERWQKFLLEVLDEGAVAQQPARAALRDAARRWNGRASTDSVAYRVVKAFRGHVITRALAPFAGQAKAVYEPFAFRSFIYEDAVWQLVHEQPDRLLDPAQPSWAALLLAAADDVTADVARSGGDLAEFTWGARNTLTMRHPFGRFLPALLARRLDMPAVPLPGDGDMPRVQTARFGQSERMIVSPGREAEGILQMPGGQSGHPFSPFYRAGHDAWVKGEPTPFLPGPARHTLTLRPQ
jgi:penicillin amidase